MKFLATSTLLLNAGALGATLGDRADKWWKPKAGELAQIFIQKRIDVSGNSIAPTKVNIFDIGIVTLRIPLQKGV